MSKSRLRGFGRRMSTNKFSGEDVPAIPLDMTTDFHFCGKSSICLLFRLILLHSAAASAPKDIALLLRLVRPLLSNVLGSFFMGLLTGVRLHTKIGPRIYEGLASGLLGTWTTFGGYEILELLQTA